MKITIDISALVYGSGVSVYTRHLVENLLKIDLENEYQLFAGTLRRKQDIKDFLGGLNKGNFSSRILPVPPTLADILWNKLHFPSIELFCGKSDVFHSSDWTQPPAKSATVTTVHDLVPVLHPEWSFPNIIRAHNKRLKWVRKEVDMVIVPTKTTKEDLVSLGFDKKRISVISEGVNPALAELGREESLSILKKYNASGKHLLAVGVNERKNTSRIIEAYRNIKDKELKLVIVGHPYKDYRSVPGVVFTGHVSEAEYPAFFFQAEALVYPSLYEGFGLPILDAFSLGVPVVTSNTGSMAEVAGEAAVLVEPEDTDSISEGIVKAMENRSELIRLGSDRKSLFSWNKCASETLEIYRHIGV